MQIHADVAQDERTGRWRWQAAVFKDIGELKSVIFSVVNFETEQEARDELNAHADAKQDATDRLVRSKTDISKLVRAAMQSARACAGAEIPRVYWHSVDERGCNWDVDYAAINLETACFNEVSQIIGRIREAYNIPNEG